MKEVLQSVKQYYQAELNNVAINYKYLSVHGSDDMTCAVKQMIERSVHLKLFIQEIDAILQTINIEDNRNQEEEKKDDWYDERVWILKWGSWRFG